MIHEKIEFLRKANNLSQKYCASELEIDTSEYQRIETGKRKNIPLIMKEKLAEMFKVPLETLESNSPFLLIVNNNDNATQNNAPFGNQTFDSKELINISLQNQKLMLELIKSINEMVNAK